MDETTIRLIRESFAGAGATMAATNVSLVMSFYTRLFATAPEVRGMFAADISVQAEKLEETLQFAVASLSNPEMLVEPLRDLGARHDGIGVKKAHYAVVTDVLVATLAEALGDGWTPEYEAAWRDLLAFVSGTMMEGAAMKAVA